MYNNLYPYQGKNFNYNKKDSRFVGGGFLAPFLLGGITGGLLAPAFYPRPIYTPIPYYPPVYPRPYQNNVYPITYY